MLRWLTDAALAESIAGDLEEERRRRARISPTRATLWFWSASLAMTLHLLRPAIREFTLRTPFMRNLPSDVRDTVRLFRRAPLFGAAAVLILALGTGATAAMLSLADATLLRPLPIPQVDRVLQSTFSFSYRDFRDLEREHGAFSQVVAWSYGAFGLEQDGDVRQVVGAAVSGEYFSLAGQQPVAGRLLTPTDDAAGAPARAVISERLWARAFNRNPSLVGTTVMVNRRPAIVIGISPTSFRGLSLQVAPELFVNLSSLPDLSTGFLASPETLADRGRVFLTLAGRLQDGENAVAANDEARRIYYAQRSAKNPDTSVWFAPLLTQAVGTRTADDLRRFLTILLGASALAMLLTCATVANLLLVRAERRRHEMAVRAALGAGRARLSRLLFVESLAIGAAGGIAGVGIAALALQMLAAFSLPGQIAIRDLNLQIDIWTVAACAGLGLLTALFFGLAPIWQTRRVDAGATLRTGTRITTRHAARTTLVGVQVALCVLLLGGSLAFGRAIAHALAFDLGFNVEHTSITAIDPSLTRLASSRAAELRREALSRLRARPGIRAAGWGLRRPMSGGFVVNPIIEGRATGATPLDIQANVVTDGYFDAMEIPVVAGRVFAAEDSATSPRAAVVSSALARRLWPEGEVLGRRLSMEDPGSPDMKWITVVGIVSDIHRTLAGPPVPMLYLVAGQTPEGFSPDYLFVRADAADSILPEVRAVLRELEPRIAITSSIQMAQHVSAPLMAHRLGLTLFLMFGGLAIALTGFGLYAVIATAVSQRTCEIGIRVALGAPSAGILSMVLRQGVWPVTAGLVAGIVAMVLSARLIQGFMFSLRAVSVWTVVVIATAIAALAALAMAVPARRALAVDPTAILRAEH